LFGRPRRNGLSPSLRHSLVFNSLKWDRNTGARAHTHTLTHTSLYFQTSFFAPMNRPTWDVQLIGQPLRRIIENTTIADGKPPWTRRDMSTRETSKDCPADDRSDAEWRAGLAGGRGPGQRTWTSDGVSGVNRSIWDGADQNTAEKENRKSESKWSDRERVWLASSVRSRIADS